MFQPNLWRQYFDQSAFSFCYGVRVKIGVEVAAGERFWNSFTVTRFEKVVGDEGEQDAF